MGVCPKGTLYQWHIQVVETYFVVGVRVIDEFDNAREKHSLFQWWAESPAHCEIRMLTYRCLS